MFILDTRKTYDYQVKQKEGNRVKEIKLLTLTYGDGYDYNEYYRFRDLQSLKEFLKSSLSKEYKRINRLIKDLDNLKDINEVFKKEAVGHVDILSVYEDTIEVY